MGQCNNRPSKKIVYSHEELIALRNDGKIDIKSYRVLTDNSALVSYSPVAEQVMPYNSGNLLVAALVTSHGRIMLMNLCTTLEKNGYIVGKK